ncbi:MAG: hypothetical protein J6B77_07635, partial [Clostridia bacterium]|nr:hypothetical protein [Clostridia bacterium]
LMLRNKMRCAPAERLPEGINEILRHISIYVNDYSPEPEDTVTDIEIVGGIWNFNNMEQNPNPQQTKDFSIRAFSGAGMLFYNVRGIKLSDMTLKDPSNYAIAFDRVSYFTVEHLTFDFNYGNPYALNMDGIHLNGNCHFDVMRDMKGACYDDLVALNADEGSHGPITNIEIDGIFAEKCHSAVRLLSVHHRVEKIHISNVFGTYYQYCIGISKHYPGVTDGGFDTISIDHVYASKAVREPHLYPFPNSYVYPLIWIQKDSYVRNLTVTALHRREYNVPVETFHVGQNTVVERLLLDDVTTENHTGEPMPLLVNKGVIRVYEARSIRGDEDAVVVNEGTIGMA